MERTRPEIAATPNGPYEVSGELPITPKHVVVSKQGEALTWATAERLPHDSPIHLCRCGQSKAKPFCDNSHLTADFDGTETASTEPFSEGRKTYEGPGMKVHHAERLCAHAGFCGNRTIEWDEMLPDTDDNNVRVQLIGMIEHCPSGALVYEIDGEINEPDLPRAVSPIENGPIWVTGSVTIVRSDGIPLETRNRVTLCRCGHSNNKPLCDGTHSEIGFEAKHPAEFSSPEPATRGEGPGIAPGFFRRIVVGVSQSTTAETYQVAAMVAEAASSEVSVVHAGTERAKADRVLSDALDLAAEAGVPHDRLTSILQAENPSLAVSRAAEDAGAGLMIVGRGGVRLGPVPHRLSYHSPCDLLVVAERGTDRPERYRRLLIATDGSATADRAARRGYDFARALDASVDLVFVGHPATGELIAADTTTVYGNRVATEVRLLQGNSVRRILETAEAIDADLIVVGNKGIARSRVLLRASVPGGVLKGAMCDILLCRTVRQLESELGPGEGGVIERHGESMAAFVDEDGELHLMSARCPHLDCLVAWNPTDKTFDCPCHGSRFGPLGEVVDGPASKPLRPV